MKNKLRSLITTTGFLLALNQFSFANCCAVPYVGNWYVAASGAVAWHNDLNLELNDSSNTTFSFDYKPGGGAAASVGYVFVIWDPCPWDLRFEAEFLYRRNSFKYLTTTVEDVSVRIPIEGSNQDSAIMVNLIMDSCVFCDLSFYLGGGIGGTSNKIELELEHEVIDDNQKRLFAWQILAGFSYRIYPNLFFTTGYRFFATAKLGIKESLKLTHIPMTHSIDIGLRLRL